MQKQSVARNYLYNFSYQILLLIVPLLTTPYLSKVLGPNAIGEYGYTQSICTYFILFGTIGINMYGQREVAYIQSDVKQRSQLFFEIVILRFITITFSLFFYLTFFSNKALYATLFLIQVIDIIAAACDISWFYQGLEDFKKTVIRNFIVKFIGVFVIFTFIKTPNDLPLYVLCNSVVLILGNLSLWMYLSKTLVKVKFKDLQITRHIKPTIILFLPQIATQIYTVLDKTMIGELSTIKEVGLYEQAQKIVKIGLSIVTALGTVMLPRMANVYASGDKKEMNKLMENSFQFTLLLAIPILFGLISVANYFVPMFLGDKFDGSINIVIASTPIILLIALSNVIGMQYLLPTKKQKQFTTSVVAGAFVNFVVNFILIPKYHAVGAAIGSVCAELTVTLIQAYAIRNDFKLNKIFTIAFKKIIAAFFMAIFVNFMLSIVSVNMLSLFSIIVIGVIIYFIILLLLRDEWIIGRIFKSWKKNDILTS